MKIGSAELDLVKDATFSEGITTCETCAEHKCRNGGVCQEAPTKEGYACICPSGFNGDNCDKVKKKFLFVFIVRISVSGSSRFHIVKRFRLEKIVFTELAAKGNAWKKKMEFIVSAHSEKKENVAKMMSKSSYHLLPTTHTSRIRLQKL